MAGLMTNLNEKVTKSNNLHNIKVKLDTVLNQRTDNLENTQKCPLLVLQIKAKCIQEFHLFHYFNDI